MWREIEPEFYLIPEGWDFWLSNSKVSFAPHPLRENIAGCIKKQNKAENQIMWVSII